MAILLIVCLFALATQGLLTNALYENCGVENVDEQVDELLKTVQENNEDPMRLDDHDSKVGNLREGQLWGIDSLVRKGPAHVECEGDKIRITVNTVAEQPIRARWEWSQKLSLTTLKGVAYLKAEVFEAKFVVIKDKTGEYPSVVEDMEITQLKQSSVEFSGLAHISWIASKITTYLSKYFQRTLKHVLDEPLTRVFDKSLLESHLKEKAGHFF